MLMTQLYLYVKLKVKNILLWCIVQWGMVYMVMVYNGIFFKNENCQVQVHVS